MSRQSVMLDSEQKNELSELFKSIDADGNGTICVTELAEALACVGIKLAKYEVRNIVETLDVDGDGALTVEEFEKLYIKLKEQADFGRQFKKTISTRKDIQTTGGSTEGTTHTVKDSELPAFSEWIIKKLENDSDCKELQLLPKDPQELFSKLQNGIVLCKLINHSVEDTIDERTINKKNLNVYLRVENQNLALMSAQAIGCNVVNIGPADIEAKSQHLMLGLLWQIIRIGLLGDINLTDQPGLVLLLEDGETLEDLMKLSPEQILIRWVNYHLAQAGESRRIANFSSDIKDSEVYFTLLNQIAPKEANIDTSGANIRDELQRAEAMLMESDKIGCRAFVTNVDVVKGNSKLNLAFVANLFNTCPKLDGATDVDTEDFHEETREEKTYRNWMNSLGVSPHVHRLNGDLVDGLVLFQLYDKIKPGTVHWPRVIKEFKKMSANFQKLGNCNYAVELGKEMKFSLIGIEGNDIRDGNAMLTLALVWQLMRAYTVALLTKVSVDGNPINDSIIVAWANDKLKEGGKKCTVSSFLDSTLSDSISILHLIDCISPKKVNWDMVKTDQKLEHEEKMLNAKYAISMGRKIGARIYALPEDIVEVKNKMVMTIFACLMTIDFQNMKKEEES